tara:strand:+ start:1579 stop:2121 length:543 start_codon:yes stop_codon:yes gene_type:complete
MFMKTKSPFILCSCAVLMLASGCSSVKDRLGLNKKAPDEFKVLKRAPLEMPPSMTLPSPRPGQQRPQEQDTQSAAAEAVFGEENVPSAHSSTKSQSGLTLLQQAGAQNADPNIREKVTRETEELNKTNKTVAEKLIGVSGFGGDKDPASIIDAEKEAERIKQNKEANKPINSGDVPTIEE